MRIKCKYFNDGYGFTYLFPVDDNKTIYIGCRCSSWRKLQIGDMTFMCGTLTQEMYDSLFAECTGEGTFIV